MRTLVCDLAEDRLAQLHLPFVPDVIIGPAQIDCARGCSGCFGCWLKTPGSCVKRDCLTDMGALLGATSELTVISRNVFGGFSPQVKRVLERCLAYLHPCFQIKDGVMRHRMRYANTLQMDLWLYGPATDSELATFLKVASEMKADFGAHVRSVHHSIRWGDIGTGAGADLLSSGTHPAKDAWLQDPGTDAPLPHTPQKVALVNASPKGADSATAHLLGDFADALDAYSRLSDESTPELAWLRCDDAGDLQPMQPTAPLHGKRRDPADMEDRAARPAFTLDGADALLIGYPLYIEMQPSGLTFLLDRFARERGLTAGTRIYAICNMGFYEPERILPSFAVLRNFCRKTRLSWCGGTAVGGGGIIRTTASSPRMGRMRVDRSLAIDRLVAAVRMGLGLDEAQARTGGTTHRHLPPSPMPDTVLAPCPIPRALYRLSAEHVWKREARKRHVNLDAQVPYKK